jgi:hypothetical protein
LEVTHADALLWNAARAHHTERERGRGSEREGEREMYAGRVGGSSRWAPSPRLPWRREGEEREGRE